MRHEAAGQAQDTGVLPMPHPEATHAAGRAVWLERLLRDGPVMVCEIKSAAKAFGVSMKTAERAKKKLGVKALRQGRGWAWRLQGQEQGGHGAVPVVQAEIQDRHAEHTAEQPTDSGRPAFPPVMVRNKYAKSGPQPRLVPLMSRMGR